MNVRRALFVALVVVGAVAAAIYSRPVQSIRLMGSTDVTMLDTIRAELMRARMERRRHVRFDIISPGGPVFIAIEIAREIRDAYDRDGIIVEMHAMTLCASGCTVVLSAGTPGYRFINQATMFLVHPIQTGGGCLDHPAQQVTQDE